MIIDCNKLLEILSIKTHKIIIAFDWGKNCTGVAITDDTMQMILPCSPVIMADAKNKKNFWAKLVADYNADAVVIGIPKHHEDMPNPTAESIMIFANTLNAELIDSGFTGDNEIPISFIDESGTSKAAENLQHDTMTAGTKLTRKKKRESLNSLSACLILERFICKQSVL
ncbi:MAG: Holliday junction resolvase RuvX [Rickettsiales bacterium]|nr:Holliday junction resolvase RuvX [Rickettsiales bacterium]